MVQKEQPDQKNQRIDPDRDLVYKVIGSTQSLNRSDKILLRRTQGLTSDNLSAAEKIRFYSLFASGDDDVQEVPHKRYIRDCLLFGVQIACLQDGRPQADTKIQDIIAKEYKAADKKSSRAARIEAFMGSEGHDDKMFFKNLAWLITWLAKDKNINVYSLTYDLITWDHKYGGREKWLRAITSSDKPKGGKSSDKKKE